MMNKFDKYGTYPKIGMLYDCHSQKNRSILLGTVRAQSLMFITQ